MSSVKSATTIHLSGGDILANIEDGLVHARGVRYARAERFNKPVAVTTWDEAQDCTVPAPITPQNHSQLATIMGDIEANRVQSEDSLRVSVLAPENAKGLPVMVYIHGGAFLTGGGDLDALKPWDIAKRGVVVVSVSYRLGIFGYLPIPNVSPANLGLLDQIEALKWVQKNVSAFGGDSSNVTVFGQSAGADSIFALLVTDGTDDLFRRAILQSTPLGRVYEDWTVMTGAMAEHATRAFEGKNPQEVPVATVLEIQTAIMLTGQAKVPYLVQYAPIYGQYPLPPVSELSKRFAAASLKKDILIGYTSDEDTAFTYTDSRRNARYLLNLFQKPIDELIDQAETLTGKRVPSYELTWYPNSSILKAAHCIDLPMLFGKWKDWEDAMMLQGPESKEVVESLGEAMKNLWVAFAKGYDLKGQRIVLDANYRFP